MSIVRIVLDTNGFFGDVHATRDRLRALLASASAGDVEVVVPQVVLDELARQYPERLDRLKAELEKATAKLDGEARRLGIGIEKPELAPIDPKDYPKQLRRRLLENQVRIAPHPRELSPFIGRCVAKRRPFSDTGAGLADAVIWSVALNSARDGNVILVTSNTRDFSDPTDPGRLHPDLVADLAAAEIPTSRVRIIPDVESLMDAIIKPLALPDVRAERLIRNTVAGGRLRTEIAAALNYELVPESALNLDVELLEDPRIIDMRIEDIRLNVARELAPGRLLLDLDITAKLDLEVYVDAQDRSLDYSSDLFVIDRRLEDEVAEATAEVLAELRIEVTTDLDARQVDGVELRGVKPL